IQADGRVDWPGHGQLRASLQNVGSGLFNDFLKAHPEQVQVHKFIGSAEWTNGPATFVVELSAQEFLPQTLPLTLELAMRGGTDGIVLSNLVVSSQTSAVVVACGRLPMRINPASQTNAVDFDLHKPLQFIAKTEPHAFFWNELVQRTGVTLQNPNLDVNVS